MHPDFDTGRSGGGRRAGHAGWQLQAGQTHRLALDRRRWEVVRLRLFFLERILDRFLDRLLDRFLDRLLDRLL